MPVPESQGVGAKGWLTRLASVRGWALRPSKRGPSAAHINPVVIVALLLASSGAIGAVWSWRGWPGALAAAAPMPLMHMTKHLLGLPDTIQPNTLDTIVMMALFALAVAGAGLAGGAALRQAATDAGA